MKRLRDFTCWLVTCSMVLGPLGCVTTPEPVPTSKEHALELALAKADAMRADPERMQDQLDQDLRIASMALDQGNHRLARDTLIHVTSMMAANLDADEQIGQANREAVSAFGEEREKYFIGDPYEQLFAYLYLGMLDIQAGDYTNAAAMFRSASLADQAAMEEGYKSDCYLTFLLEGVAARMDGDTVGAEEAFRLAQTAFNFRQRMPVIQQAFYIALSNYLDDLSPIDPDDPDKRLVPDKAEFNRLDQLFPTVFSQLPASLSIDQDYDKAIIGAFQAASRAVHAEPAEDTPEARLLACYIGDSVGRASADLEVFQGYVLKALISDALVLEAQEGATASEARFADLVARCNDPGTNTFLVRQVGMAPVKVRGGKYGNKISFRSYPCPVAHSLSTLTRVDVEGEPLYATFGQFGESVDYQAKTRGGRAMDHILKGKVLYRDTFRVTSSIAGGAAAAAVAAGAMVGAAAAVVTTTTTTVVYTTTASGTTVATTTTTTSTTLSGSAALSAAAPFLAGAVALIVIWKVSKMIADAVHPEGDIRGWHELPGRLFITCAALEPGQYELQSHAFDPLARPLPEATEAVRFRVEPNRPSLVLVGSPWR